MGFDSDGTYVITLDLSGNFINGVGFSANNLVIRPEGILYPIGSLIIAGGGLVNPAGTALRSSVKPYSLKKDFTNIKFYKIPVKIIRVAKTRTSGAGYGESAIAGDWYKIYIAKKDGSQPAPVHIVYPENHALIKTPKIIQGGSF